MMSSPNLMVLRTYQFLGEALFFYLFLAPIYYVREVPLPLWSYLIAVVGTILFFNIGVKWTATYLPVLLYAPIAVMCLVGLGYDLLLAVMLAGFFSWRFIRHFQEEGIENEKQLMVFGLFILLIECLFIRSFALYFMVSLMIGVLIFGHLLSHVVSIKISNSSNKPFPQAAVIAGMFLTITGIAYTAYEGLGRIIGGILTVITGGLSLGVLGVIHVLNFMGIEFSGLEALVKRMEIGQEGTIDLPERNHLVGEESSDAAVAERAGETMYWGLLTVLVVIGVIIGVILLKKKVLNRIEPSPGDESSVTSKWNKGQRRSIRDRLAGFFGKKPDNPVRQMFFDLERFAHKKGLGRKNYETIEDWFERLGVKGVDVDVYQKVRYGDDPSLTEEEIETFKRDLHQLRQSLLEKTKDE